MFLNPQCRVFFLFFFPFFLFFLSPRLKKPQRRLYTASPRYMAPTSPKPWHWYSHTKIGCSPVLLFVTNWIIGSPLYVLRPLLFALWAGANSDQRTRPAIIKITMQGVDALKPPFIKGQRHYSMRSVPVEPQRAFVVRRSDFGGFLLPSHPWPHKVC